MLLAMLFSHAFDGGIFRVGFFWDWLNVHTFNHRHRADRRVKGLVAEWVGRGMDANICIACLRQGFCIRKTR
jgi:hypothetical protein